MKKDDEKLYEIVRLQLREKGVPNASDEFVREYWRVSVRRAKWVGVALLVFIPLWVWFMIRMS